MPLYEYECTQCKRHTEKIQKFCDAEITQCPHCGGLLERVVSAPAIAFKGGGWFADGYGNSKPSAGKNDSKSDSDSSSGSASETASPSQGTESKSASSESSSTPVAAPAQAPSSPSSSENK